MNPLMTLMNRSNWAQVDIKSIQSIISLLKEKNPSEVTTMLLNGNPQFKSFYDANKNKPAEEICKEYGIDYGLIKQLLNK